MRHELLVGIPAFTGLHSVPGVVGRYSCLYRPAVCQELLVGIPAFTGLHSVPGVGGRLSISIPILEPEILGNHNINTGTTRLSKTIVN